MLVERFGVTCICVGVVWGPLTLQLQGTKSGKPMCNTVLQKGYKMLYPLIWQTLQSTYQWVQRPRLLSPSRSVLLMALQTVIASCRGAQCPIWQKARALAGLGVGASGHVPFFRIWHYKKKISRHIKFTVYAWSTKCWRNQKLIVQFSCTLRDERFESN